MLDPLVPPTPDAEAGEIIKLTYCWVGVLAKYNVTLLIVAYTRTSLSVRLYRSASS